MSSACSGDENRQRCGRRGVGRRPGSFQRVCPDTTGPAFLVGDSIVYSPKAGGVARFRHDGAIETLQQQALPAAAMFGDELYYLLSDTITATPRRCTCTDLGRRRAHHVTWLAISTHLLALGSTTPSSNQHYYSGIAPDIYDLQGDHLAAESEAAGPANRDPLTGNRMISSMNAAGLSGSIEGDTDPAAVGSADVVERCWCRIAAGRHDRCSVDQVLVTYNIGTNGVDAAELATKSANGTSAWEDLPATAGPRCHATDPGVGDGCAAMEPPDHPSLRLAGPFGVTLIEYRHEDVTTTPTTRVVFVRSDRSVLYPAPERGGLSRRWRTDHPASPTRCARSR